MQTTIEAAGLAGISYRQFDYWRSNGVLPWVPSHVGSGRVIRVDAATIRVCSILGRLTDLVPNLPLADLAAVAAIARGHDSGLAVKVGDVWQWRPIVHEGAGGGDPFVAVPLGA